MKGKTLILGERLDFVCKRKWKPCPKKKRPLPVETGG
jgi:hypothetical protein